MDRDNVMGCAKLLLGIAIALVALYFLIRGIRWAWETPIGDIFK
jgi:hypothetical protein